MPDSALYLPWFDGGEDTVRFKTGDGDLLPLKGDIIEFPGCCMALEGDTESILITVVGGGSPYGSFQGLICKDVCNGCVKCSG